MRHRYTFDWTGFDEKRLDEVNQNLKSGALKEAEDILYGYLPCSVDEDEFLVDIHYEYYGYADRCFDFEVYRKKSHLCDHGDWLGSIKVIKGAKDYKRFCHRAEDAIIKFFSAIL